MIEMRWAAPPETTTKADVLQYRYELPQMPALGFLGSSSSGKWSDWIDVPRVVVPTV